MDHFNCQRHSAEFESGLLTVKITQFTIFVDFYYAVN